MGGFSLDDYLVFVFFTPSPALEGQSCGSNTWKLKFGHTDRMTIFYNGFQWGKKYYRSQTSMKITAIKLKCGTTWDFLSGLMNLTTRAPSQTPDKSNHSIPALC